MKKLLILSILLTPFCVMAEEAVTFNGINEPEWKDFAPQAFVNVEEPKGLGKFNEAALYWYKRKVEFYEGLVNCRALDNSDEQFTCYQQLKVKQYQENSDYNARVEAQERARLCPEEMYDKTNNMLPIGGYLNNFTRFQPNEFR